AIKLRRPGNSESATVSNPASTDFSRMTNKLAGCSDVSGGGECRDAADGASIGNAAAVVVDAIGVGLATHKQRVRRSSTGHVKSPAIHGQIASKRICFDGITVFRCDGHTATGDLSFTIGNTGGIENSDSAIDATNALA